MSTKKKETTIVFKAILGVKAGLPEDFECDCSSEMKNLGGQVREEVVRILRREAGISPEQVELQDMRFCRDE